MILHLTFVGGRDGAARRQEILDLVEAEPGIHKSEIRRRTDLAWGTITYHIHLLVSEGRVHSTTWRGKHVLVPVSMPPNQMHWLLALRQDERCQVLEAVSARPGRGVQAIADELQMSRKVIRKHLTVLGDAGLIERSAGYRARYSPRTDAILERVQEWMDLHHHEDDDE